MKPPLTIDQQIGRLRDHNIDVIDEEYARSVLARCGYYSFAGYALEFREKPGVSDCVAGTTFESIAARWSFDVELRSLLLSELLSIESFFKSIVAREFSLLRCAPPSFDQHYCASSYYNPDKALGILEDACQNAKGHHAKEKRFQRHLDKHGGRMPLWTAVHAMTFPSICNYYRCMYRHDQEQIARSCGTSRTILGDQMAALSLLRNICAHSDRLYNNSILRGARLPRSVLKRLDDGIPSDSVFFYILVMLQRIQSGSEKEGFISSVLGLADEYRDRVALRRVGFPEDYQDCLEMCRGIAICL